MSKVLSKTCVKINNEYFDIVEDSAKVKKGYGTKEVITTIGEGGKIKRNVIDKISERYATGSFQILNTQAHQDAIDKYMGKEDLTIEFIDPNGNYKPITNACITNDPEWVASSDGVDIEFAGDAMEE